MSLSDQHITILGEACSDDLRLTVTPHGIDAEMSDDIQMICRFDLATALQLGEWLIAQAIAGGARPVSRSPATENTNHA